MARCIVTRCVGKTLMKMPFSGIQWNLSPVRSTVLVGGVQKYLHVLNTLRGCCWQFRMAAIWISVERRTSHGRIIKAPCRSWSPPRYLLLRLLDVMKTSPGNAPRSYLHLTFQRHWASLILSALILFFIVLAGREERINFHRSVTGNQLVMKYLSSREGTHKQ